MDYTEQEEIEIYQPNHNQYIGNPLGSEVNFGLFSIKNDKPRSILVNDNGHDIDHEMPNLEVHRLMIEQNRVKAMDEFGVARWEPDLTF